MALVTQEIFSTGDDNAARVSITYNDANGSLNKVAWTINGGSLHVLIRQQGKPDIDQTMTTSGSVNPPAGYNLVPGPRGTWVFANTIFYEITWEP